MLRHVLIALIALFVSATVACGEELMSPTQFRDAGVERIRAAEPTAVIEIVDRQMIRMTIPGDAVRSGVEVNFERAYQAYVSNPARREELLDQWTQLAVQQPLAQFTRDRLVVVLRALAVVRSYDASLQQQGERLVSQPYVGDLYVVLAFDTGPAIAYATASHIVDLGLSEDEAWGLATANLDALMGDLRVATDPSGVSFVDSESGLAPSVLLHSEVCRSGAAGDVILVTGRDGYVFANGNAANSVRSRARLVIGPNRPESRTLLSCRGGQLALDIE